MEIDELAVKITGDSTSLQTAMNQATESMGKLGINTSALTGLLGAAGLTAAFKMAYDAADKMVQAYRDDETAQLKYNAALAASAVITAQGKKALDDYVPVFASLAGIAEADTQAQIARLAAYGRTDAQIKTMMETALGMSTVLDMDVNTALTQLNMTFQGTAGRLGQQIAGIKDLTAEQLKNGEGLKFLNGKYGEFAGTLKNSTDVSIKNFENAWSDLMSTMGASIAGTIKPVRDAMTGLFRDIIAQTQDSNSALEIFATGFNNFVNIFKQAGLSIIGKGNVFTAIDEAINHTEQKTRQLLALYASIEDPIQKRIRLEKESAERSRQEAEATASKAAAEAQKAADAQIKSRKEAEEAYRKELDATDTRVKLGITTEQEAADAKYAANLKLINDLVALGYTGATATGQIGDQTLAAAIARNKTLLDDTTAVKDAILAGNYEIYLQQKDVAAWEAAYLASKKTSEESLAEGQALRVANRLAATEAVTTSMDAAEAALQLSVTVGASSTAQHEEQMAARRTVAAKGFYDAAVTASEVATAKQIADAEELAGAEEFAASQAAAAEILSAADAAAWEKNYIADIAAAKKVAYESRLAGMEGVHEKEVAAEEALQLIVTAGAESAAQHAEQSAARRAKTEQNYYIATENIATREAETQAINEAAAAEVSRKLREISLAKMVAAQLAATEKIDKAQSDANDAQDAAAAQAEIDQITHASAVALVTESLLARRLAATERVGDAQEAANAAEDAAGAQAEIDAIAHANAIATVQASLLARRLAATEAVSIAEDAAIAESLINFDSEAQRAEQTAQRKIAAAQRYADYVASNPPKVPPVDPSVFEKSLERAGSYALGVLSQIFSGFGSLFAAQAASAVDAVEDRLAALKKGYGSTASDLQKMYDALKEMGATDAALTLKSQLEKEKAVEEYASLSREQLAMLYASAIEMNNAEAIAAIEAARARVKAEDDAEAEIKAIRAEAALAEWQTKRLALLASTAQAAMDAYKFLTPLVGPVFALAGPAAAAVAGGIQLAAIDEAKPKLDTGGVVRAREGTSVTVGAGTSEVMFGTSSLGDPLMQGFADLVASKVSGSGNYRALLPVQVVLRDRVIAESTVELIDNGNVRFTKPIRVARR